MGRLCVILGAIAVCAAAATDATEPVRDTEFARPARQVEQGAPIRVFGQDAAQLATLDVDSNDPIVAYANITNDSTYGTAGFARTIFGDDIELTSCGRVDGVQFSIIHFGWSNDCGHQPGDLLACDVDIMFGDMDNPSAAAFGTVLTDTLDFSSDPLATGYGMRYTYTGLAQAGVILPTTECVIMQKTCNFVSTGDPNYSEVGPLICENTGEPPDVGSSDDTFWMDDTNAAWPADYEACDYGSATKWGAVWLHFAGVIKCDFYFAVSLIDAAFTTTAATRPEIYGGNCGSFQVAPEDNYGLGGPGYSVAADGTTTLTYDAYQPITTLIADPNSFPGHNFLKFMVRAPDGYHNDQQFDGPSHHDPAGLFLGLDSKTIEMVYDNTIQFHAEIDGVPANKLITIGLYPHPNEPAQDLDGLGDGVTPFSRRYDPAMDASEAPDPGVYARYYPTRYLALEAEAPTGAVAFKRWWLVNLEGGGQPGYGYRSLRIDAGHWASVRAIYETTYLCGDANADDAVDVFDIDIFIESIVAANPATFAATYPDLNYWNADTNCDGSVDVFDIDTFVDAVTGAAPCDCGY